MRVSDQRYAKDRLTYDVAVRLIDFEARTGTIRELTGLADFRIRNLTKACGFDGRSGRIRRHRGAPPRCLGTILGKPSLKQEAAALLGLCQLMGVTNQEEHTPDLAWNRIARVERLCDAYWTFRYLLPEATISFEHMLLLLSEADRGVELATAECGSCDALMVVDRLAVQERLCCHCEAEGTASYRTRTDAPTLRVAEEPAGYR